MTPATNTHSFSMFSWSVADDGPGYPLSFLGVEVPPLLKDVLTAQSFSGWYQFDPEHGNSGGFYYEVDLLCDEFPFLKYAHHGHTYFVETAKARVEYLVSLFLERVQVYAERKRLNELARQAGIEELPIPGTEHELLLLAEHAEPLDRANAPLSAEFIAHEASKNTLAGCIFFMAVGLLACIVGVALGWLVFVVIPSI